MARRTDEEKLQELNKKMEQLQNQKKALLARQRTAAEKARTRRLIQNGALAEKFFQCSDIAPEEFEKLLRKIVATNDVSMLLLSRKVENGEKAVLDGDEPIIEELGNGDSDA